MKFLSAVLCLTVPLVLTLPLERGPQKGAAPEATGNEACASCHSEIYKSYLTTAMAHASGPALEGFVPGEFDDKISGVTFRVYERDGRAWMSYERGGELRGEREFVYFIGTGKKGRTYLFFNEGYLFEAPINWYSQENRWNMTPGYIEAREVPMNLPAFSSCLNCHTSGMQPRIAGTRNKFAGKPFLHDGITCERCHGSGEAHLDGKGAIVNPAKLSSERRDSVCMECHFEGTVAVEQPGKRIHDFQPGDLLSEYAHYFLANDNQPQKAEALSQFEALSLSACKRKSGDSMWCGTCHNPHREPKPEEKAAYYRSKCLECHGEAFAAKHHANKPDCISCHMPELPSKDVAHTQSTDHRILKRPGTLSLQGESPVHETRLEAFPKNTASLVTTRDLALAWQALARRGFADAVRQSEEYLRKALQETPDDARLLSSYAFVEQQRGKSNEARDLYQHALQLRPRANTSAANLGILEARSGDLRDAVKLWQPAFQRVPYQSAIGMDLAFAFCAAGQKEDARHYLERVLEFNPDDGTARKMLARLDTDCKPQK